MEARWEVRRRNGGIDANEAMLDATVTRYEQWVPVVPCDDAAVERVARELCRQRGWSWDASYTDTTAALMDGARKVLRAAGETP